MVELTISTSKLFYMGRKNLYKDRFINFETIIKNCAMQLIVEMSKFLKICFEKGGKQDVSRGILLLQWFEKD